MTQPLPLPPLEQTITKFLHAIKPVFSATDVSGAEASAAAFLQTEGPALQQQLEDYAQTQAAKGKSWLSDYWLDGYLTGREIKSLSSNVGFAIDFSSNKTQLARAAEFIHLMAQTHRDYAQGNVPALDDGRGNLLSMDGWRVLNGAMRLPKAGADEMYYASCEAANRHISLLYEGQHYLLQVTDGQGEVCSPQALEQALQQLSDIEQTLPFSLVSALPSDEAGYYLAKLCDNKHNQAVYTALKDSWFCLSLFASQGQPDEIELLQQHSFLPAHAWQYKPFTYQLDLNSDFICVQVEHTGLDGGTLQAILKYAFALQPVTESGTSAALTPCNWQVDTALAKDIQCAAAEHNQAANLMQVRKFYVDYSALAKIKVSHDALIQFSLIYAQLSVFQQLRNTYEAVDTSHYLAGRTECLRSNTNEALALCRKLIDKSANIDDLQAALKAHKAWVIACKTGQGIDRHLYALGKLATQSDAFFTYVKQFAGADFLSTSTVGTQSPIRRFIFAPTSASGFGVNYSMGSMHYEYCVIANANSISHLDAMEEAIKTGAEQLIAMLVAHNP